MPISGAQLPSLISYQKNLILSCIPRSDPGAIDCYFRPNGEGVSAEVGKLSHGTLPRLSLLGLYAELLRADGGQKRQHKGRYVTFGRSLRETLMEAVSRPSGGAHRQTAQGSKLLKWSTRHWPSDRRKSVSAILGAVHFRILITTWAKLRRAPLRSKFM